MAIVADKSYANFYRLLAFSKALASTVLLLAFCAAYFMYTNYRDEKQQQHSLALISQPKIDDIYFLDYRKLSDDLRPSERYRLAKVVDITGDIITLEYGNFYYQYQYNAENSIHYGQLENQDYFAPKRYDLSLAQLRQMYDDGAIYRIARPVRSKLFGRPVGPEQKGDGGNIYIYGWQENIAGEGFLHEKYNELSRQLAFEQFQRSADYGYAPGQVNLAQMYLTGPYPEKDLEQALHWLKLASLQSYKPAILKYGIVCKQVTNCRVYDFYRELTEAGVNLKVRNVEFELTPLH